MEFLKREIEELKRKELYRELRHIETPQGKRVVIDGRELLNFSSNDYLGLAKEFDCECLKRWGAGSGASRLISGSFKVHRELEKELANLKKTEEALLFSTGYMANLGVISALAGKGDLILSDELNHASIIDGIRLSRANKAVYPHRDWEFVKSYLKRERRNYRRCFIVTDSVFSMDGDLAPLKELFEIKDEFNAVLIVDDAHATGVIGWSSFEVFKIEPDERTVIVGTLGKALGTFGAFVAGSSTLREYLINRCRSFIFTTALPPFIACQTLKNIEKVEERRKRLLELISFFKKLTGIKTESAIFPFIVRGEREAVELSKYLYKKGFFVPAIRPPTVKESRLRITITAENTKEELKELWKTIKEWEKRGAKPPKS